MNLPSWITQILNYLNVWKQGQDLDEDDILDQAEGVDDGTYSKTAQQISEHIDSTSDPHSTIPSQTGNADKFLTTNGTTTSWDTPTTTISGRESGTFDSGDLVGNILTITHNLGIAKPGIKIWTDTNEEWEPYNIDDDTGNNNTTDVDLTGATLGATTWTWVATGGELNADTAITDLTDTPSTYDGSAGDVLRANATNDGIEFHTLVEADITDLGSYIEATDVTFENLNTNGDVGTGSAQVAAGDHNHSGTYEPADATILKDADIGVSVQAYDADTAKYDDVTANFTGTLQNGGSNVVVDTDIGSTVQAYNANTALTTDITYETLDTNGDVGTGAGQLAIGNHDHSGTYEPADATILKDADIGVNVQAYNANTALTTDITKETLATNGDVETTITDTDDKFPTSGAVVDYVAANGGSPSITITAGEALSQGDIVYKKNDDSEHYLAIATNTDPESHKGLVIVNTTSIASANTGPANGMRGSVITANTTFSTADINKELFLSDSSAGDYSTTAPTTTGTHVVCVGTIWSTTEIFFDPEYRYQN